MIIAIYALFSVSKLKKHTFIIISWLTHKFFLISYLVLFLKKIRIKIKKINIIVLSLLILIISYFFREQFINIIGEYVSISEKYYNTNDLSYAFDLYWIRRSLIKFLNFLIIIILFYDNKNIFISINIFLLTLFNILSRVVFERYLEYVLLIGVILYLKDHSKSKMRNLIIIIILLKQTIFFVQNIKYGLITNTYPFKQKILTKDEVQRYIDENGALRKNE